MDLYLLRHGIAVPHGAPGFERDSDRELTPKGAKKMRRAAEGMKAMELTFDVILSSPFSRAKQTAEIVADVFGAQKSLEFTDSLAVGGDPEDLIKLITSKYSNVQSVLLVGHEPYMSSLISLLLAGDQSVAVTMRKGGLCKLIVDSLRHGQCATLDWLLAPSHMVLMR
jgi:phosphohistidine phosphatase